MPLPVRLLKGPDELEQATGEGFPLDTQSYQDQCNQGPSEHIPAVVCGRQRRRCSRFLDLQQEEFDRVESKRFRYQTKLDLSTHRKPATIEDAVMVSTLVLDNTVLDELVFTGSRKPLKLRELRGEVKRPPPSRGKSRGGTEKERRLKMKRGTEWEEGKQGGIARGEVMAMRHPTEHSVEEMATMTKERGRGALDALAQAELNNSVACLEDMVVYAQGRDTEAYIGPYKRKGDRERPPPPPEQWQVLDFTGCGIVVEDLMVIATLLRRNSILKTLRLCDNDLTLSAGGPRLLTGVEELAKTLTPKLGDKGKSVEQVEEQGDGRGGGDGLEEEQQTDGGDGERRPSSIEALRKLYDPRVYTTVCRPQLVDLTDCGLVKQGRRSFELLRPDPFRSE